MHAKPGALERIPVERRVESGFDAEAGALIRTLAAAKPHGVILLIGAAHPEAPVWLLDGMDITTRLVVLVDDRETAERVTKELIDDIRIAIHAQPVLDFLTDISSHQMDMIVCDFAIGDADILHRIFSLLAPAGVLVCIEPPRGRVQESVDVHDLLRTNREFQSVALNLGSALAIAVRRTTVPKTRRVRRRAGRTTV
jgi:predicted O-methyltransferase YrrM